jgi:hypothetical protein
MEDMMAYRSYHRTYPRYLMQYPLIFGWASGVGEGLLTNLSFSGCSVLCDHTALVGEEVRVGILLPDQTQALSIQGGTIKWVNGRQFGVEFRHLPPNTRQRLNRTLREALINSLKTHSGHPAQSEVPA